MLKLDEGELKFICRYGYLEQLVCILLSEFYVIFTFSTSLSMSWTDISTQKGKQIHVINLKLYANRQ